MPKNEHKNPIIEKLMNSINQTSSPIKKYHSSIMSSDILDEFNESIIRRLEQEEKGKEMEEEEYIIGNYLIKNTIGQGTFGKVKLGIYIPTKEKVAVKILDKDKIFEKDDEIRLKREFDMLVKINNLNVILISEIFESFNKYYAVMEYCEGGELFNYIVRQGRLKEYEAAFLYYQLINGLEYIHSLGIVHRDLKPENLLITKECILKIIDFGLSNYFTTDKSQKLLTTPCGSPSYASPEMISGKSYDGFKIDVWSTGIILYAMLCGYLPFEDKNNSELFKKILKCEVKFPKHVSVIAKDLIKKILVGDPDKRITIDEIKKHPFYIEGKYIFEDEFNLNEYSSLSLSINEIQDDKGIKINVSNVDLSDIKDKENEQKKIYLTIDNNVNLKYLNSNENIINNEKNINKINSYEIKKKEKENIEENKINILQKKRKKIKKRNNTNSTNKDNFKSKKETSAKKKLKREHFKYKDIFNHNKVNHDNNIKKFSKKINSTMQQTNCYKLNKGKTHLFLKQKRYNSFYEMVFKNHFKNKNNLKIDIKKFNNYIKIKKKNPNLSYQITPYENKKNYINSLYLSKNNKSINKCETDINRTHENFNPLNIKNSINNKKDETLKLISKISPNNINSFLNNNISNLSNKSKQKFIHINGRKLNSKIKERGKLISYLKLSKKPITNQNTKTNFNTISLKNSKLPKKINNNLKTKASILIKKIQKNFVSDINGLKNKIKIKKENKKAKEIKPYLKTTLKTEKNEHNRRINTSKTKNLQIKEELSNMNTKKNLRLKTEAEINEKNINNIKNNNSNIKLGNISTKISNNYTEINNKENFFTIQTSKNIGMSRNIHKNIYSKINSNSINSSLKSKTKPQTKKDFKTKASFIIKSKNYIKTKKHTINVKNSTINFLIFNSNLIISSLNKKIKAKKNWNICNKSELNNSKNNYKLNFIKNSLSKDSLKYSQNLTNIDNSDYSDIKNKNNNFQNIAIRDKKYFKINSIRSDEKNKNKIKDKYKKIIRIKSDVSSRPKKNKVSMSPKYFGNKAISKNLKNSFKNINNIEAKLKKLIFYQKYNKQPSTNDKKSKLATKSFLI